MLSIKVEQHVAGVEVFKKHRDQLIRTWKKDQSDLYTILLYIQKSTLNIKAKRREDIINLQMLLGYPSDKIPNLNSLKDSLDYWFILCSILDFHYYRSNVSLVRSSGETVQGELIGYLTDTVHFVFKGRKVDMMIYTLSSFPQMNILFTDSCFEESI